MKKVGLTNSCLLFLLSLLFTPLNSWANDQNINFSEQKDQQNAQRALDSVKVLSKEIQGLKKS